MLGVWTKCLTCHESDFSARHRCKPAWEACDADEQEWDVVRAADAEDAAETYCARRDPFNEYGTVSASRAVLVRPIGRNDLRRRYIVNGDVQPVYVATLQQSDDTDPL